MSILFEPITIEHLWIRNRIMRSATAERLADPDSGAPLPRLGELYTTLAEGGVGLIVTGHAYIERQGKAHPEMASIASDDVIPAWESAIRPAQKAGAKVMLQINHSGASCDPLVTPAPLSPSGVATHDRVQPQAMSEKDIRRVILAFGQAARRAQRAGFDGVQIHGAHGYLVSQFLTPMTNLRQDEWGGTPKRRLAFLRTLVQEIHLQVGTDYPVWIKLGVAGKDESQFHVEDGAQAALACADYGIDCVEISHALGTPSEIDTRREAAFQSWAQKVRQTVGPNLPLALVSGFRTRAGMEAVLEKGLVQMVSLCRPLIAEPDLPNKLQRGEEAACLRCGKCWPDRPGEGIDCHNSKVLRELGRAPVEGE